MGAGKWGVNEKGPGGFFGETSLSGFCWVFFSSALWCFGVFFLVLLLGSSVAFLGFTHGFSLRSFRVLHTFGLSPAEDVFVWQFQVQ